MRHFGYELSLRHLPRSTMRFTFALAPKKATMAREAILVIWGQLLHRSETNDELP